MTTITALAPAAAANRGKAGISSSLDATTAAGAGGTGGAAGTDAAGSQDRFLKLLVAQLNNQDPMNPMDNAQMTSQIAQINTVTGIQQLNGTMQGIAGQFASMQLLQGSTMVGRDVLTAGDRLARADAASATPNAAGGSFDLPVAAGSVSMQVLTPGGRVLATQPLGALEAGRHHFSWDASGQPADADLRFRIVASNGATAVPATPLARDRVLSVASEGGALQLQLARGGSVPYSAVQAVL